MTTITDIFVPEVSIKGANEAGRKAGLMGTSIFVRGQVFDAAAANARKTVSVPAWKALGGSESLQTPGTNSNTSKVEQAEQVAPLLRREENYSVDSFSAAIGSADPVGYVAGEIGNSRAARYQTALVHQLRGFFGAAAAAAKLDLAVTAGAVSADNKLSANAILNATGKAGQFRNLLQGGVIMCHSLVGVELNKLEAIVTKSNSEGDIVLRTWKGFTLVEDDTLVTVSEEENAVPVYDIYILGKGCIAHGEAPQTSDVGPASLMVDTDKKANVKAIYDRTSTFFALNGAEFKSPAGMSVAGPTNEQLATAANWELVRDAKQLGMVALTVNL